MAIQLPRQDLCVLPEGHDPYSKSLLDAFLQTISTDKVQKGQALAGLFGSFCYEDVSLWNKIPIAPDYYVSRDSEKLTSACGVEIMGNFPTYSHLYLLGAGNSESFAFAQSPRVSKVTILDVSETIAREQVEYLKGKLDKTIDYARINYQTESLPVDNNHYSVVVLPGANIGNTPTDITRPIEEHTGLQRIYNKFYEEADAFVCGFDTNQDELSLKKAYSGPEHDLFILSTFQQAVDSLAIHGFSTSALRKDSRFHELSSTFIHHAINTKDQTISIPGFDDPITFTEGQIFYPNVSLKPSVSSVERLAEKTDWSLKDHYTHKNTTLILSVFQKPTSHAKLRVSCKEQPELAVVR